MIYAVDGSFVQNHEGKLKDWEKFTDCRVKIIRQRASPIRLKITEMSRPYRLNNTGSKQSKRRDQLLSDLS